MAQFPLLQSQSGSDATHRMCIFQGNSGLASHCYRQVHQRVYRAGHVICASRVPGGRVPGGRGPAISYIDSLTCRTTEVSSAFLGILLSSLPNDQNVECPVVGVIHECDGTALGDRYRGSAEGSSNHLDGIWIIARGCGAGGASGAATRD